MKESKEGSMIGLRGSKPRKGQDESFHRLCKSTLESGLFKQDFY